MWRMLFDTDKDIGTGVLRIVLGIVFFAHGAQKLLGWFGGRGFDATIAVFETEYHIPMALALVAIAAEFFGGLGLIVGLLSRIAGFGIGVSMIVAIAKKTYPYGFFMNWSGRQQGEGYEFQLLAIAMCILVVLRGSGAFSLDYLITQGRQWKTNRRPVKMDREGVLSSK
jgi:putative oxidoreductase